MCNLTEAIKNFLNISKLNNFCLLLEDNYGKNLQFRKFYFFVFFIFIFIKKLYENTYLKFENIYLN